MKTRMVSGIRSKVSPFRVVEHHEVRITILTRPEGGGEGSEGERGKKGRGWIGGRDREEWE